MNKVYKFIIILGLVGTMVTGCVSEEKKQAQMDIPILPIEVVTMLVEMDIGFDTTDMHLVNNDYMHTLFKVSETAIIDYIIKLPTGTTLNEYGVFLATKESVKDVSIAVEDYLNERKKNWDNQYLAEEKFKIDKGESGVLGQYIFYSIGGDFNALFQAILNLDEAAIAAYKLTEDNKLISLEHEETAKESEVIEVFEEAELTEVLETEEAPEETKSTEVLKTAEKSEETKSKEVLNDNTNFVSSSLVNYNDGIDIDKLNMLYLGQYKHVESMNALFASSTTSSWTQPPTRYESTKQPILWRIVGNQLEGSLTLLSEYVIDSRHFHSSPDWLSWDYTKSSIRKWLNNTFLESFSTTENNQLIKTNVVQKMWNPKSSDWVDGKFTSVWGSGAEHTDVFPKTTQGDKVYLPWRKWNSNIYYWDSENAGLGQYEIKGDAAKIQLRNGKTTCETGDSIWMMSRSPSPESANHIQPLNYTTSKFGIRPIINLKTKDIVYISPTGYITFATGRDAIRQFKINGIDALADTTVSGSTTEPLKVTVIRDKGLLGYKIVKDNIVVNYDTFDDDTIFINTLTSGVYKVYIFVETGNTGYSAEASNMISFTIITD